MPGIMPHEVHPEDRAVYWFYFLRMDPKAFRCGRSEFVQALVAEGMFDNGGRLHQACRCTASPSSRSTASSPAVGRSKELGLTSMDYTKVHRPEVEAILRTGIRVSIYEDMTEDYILAAAAAIKKVARYYAV